MASHVNNRVKGHGTGDDLIDWTNDTIKCIILSSAHSPDPDDDYVADVSANEASGANRPTLSSKALTIDDTNNEKTMEAADPTFTGVNENVSGFYVYKEVNNDADSVLIAWLEFSSVQNPGGSNFTPALPNSIVYKGT